VQLVAGTRIGRFKVLRYVATGGMADIYLVRATGIAGFEKTLVLKRIRPDHASEPQFIEMFLDEARLAATLDHPNIVHVHDIGEADGSYFFTMEYVHGESVLEIQRAVRRKAQPLGLPAALAIVGGAAAGLHFAHDKKRGGQPLGIVHRDVSPSNVLVTFDGGVKVVDFGIAKAAARLTETSAGTVKGKYGYMSPEQCRGGAIDRRSDIFELGILLFEVTTGHVLFPGDNEFEVVHKVCNEPLPRPSSLVAGYPAALEAIVLRALERDPDKRFATARELEQALAGFARDEKLSVSAVTLADTMRAVFGADVIDRDLEGREVSSVRRAPVPDEVETVAGRPRARRRPWLPIAIASGLVAAGGFAWFAGRESETASSHRADPSAAHPETAHPEAAQREPEPVVPPPAASASLPSSVPASASPPVPAAPAPADRKTKRHSTRRAEGSGSASVGEHAHDEKRDKPMGNGSAIDYDRMTSPHN